MQVSKTQVMAEQSYIYQAGWLVRNYLLADHLVACTSVLVGIYMCKMAYDVTHMISSLYYKGYASLTKIQRIEWNNRGMSSAHAIFITAMSLYLVFFSDLFSDRTEGLVIFRSSSLSIFTLGVLHHLLSATAISYTMLSGEGQLYTYMVLISETTTPGINLRWFLDTAGMKKSSAYLVNGVMMFIAWLVARILLFIYLFYYIYLYYDQIRQMHTLGYLLTLLVPAALFIMNIMWFTKILRGLRKTLAKRQ